ncbi:MAG: hypothetical protein PSY12_09145 [bacterium]|nr:hypothetical protein [bacterium]
MKPDVRSVQGNSEFSGSYDFGRGNFNGTDSYSGTVNGTQARGYEDQVDVEVSDQSGRIRLPRVTLPMVHGGDDGWFELKNVKVTHLAIDANAAVNIINKPKIHIDRRTGTIAITGKNGDFSGQCRAIDPNEQRRF